MWQTTMQAKAERPRPDKHSTARQRHSLHGRSDRGENESSICRISAERRSLRPAREADQLEDPSPHG